MLVKVTSGFIENNKTRYDIGESFHVSEETAENFERLGVAKIIGKPTEPAPEPAPAPEPEPEPEPAPEEEVEESPVMAVDNSTFEKQGKSGKRGKGKR